MAAEDILIGAGSAWIAPVGEAYPAINAVPAGNWVSLGRTDGGTTVKHINTLVHHKVDQALMPVKSTRTDIGVEVQLPLAEITLERYAKVINNTTVTDVPASAGVAGYRYFTITATSVVATHAILVRVPSPYLVDTYMQYELKCCVQSGEPDPTFNAASKAILATTWTALEDPANPGTIGRMLAQDAAPL